MDSGQHNQPIHALVERLAKTSVPAGLYNQYAYDCEKSAICRHNLSLYLQQMAEREPDTLLVGEAAGHRGCRLTGVPFTSEFILMQGGTGHALFGAKAGFRKAKTRSRPAREHTATMVWEILGSLPTLPLLWNALPFHPHLPDRPRSNRTPRRSELALGRQFLALLQAHFPGCTVIAVGNKAAHCLGRWGIPHDKVRHPSFGGKADFTEGLQRLLKGETDARDGINGLYGKRHRSGRMTGEVHGAKENQ